MEMNKAFVANTFWLTNEYAGILLRESDLPEIAHYFEYTADEWADFYLAL